MWTGLKVLINEGTYVELSYFVDFILYNVDSLMKLGESHITPDLILLDIGKCTQRTYSLG